MYDLFPVLRERADAPAGVMSGGEQQMLTLCRTLMGDPELVMIDEPTEGLAPKIVELVARLFEEIQKRGVSILLVEQKLTIALSISQRLYVMGHGQIVFEGTPDDCARTRRCARSGWKFESTNRHATQRHERKVTESCYERLIAAAAMATAAGTSSSAHSPFDLLASFAAPQRS